MNHCNYGRCTRETLVTYTSTLQLLRKRRAEVEPSYEPQTKRSLLSEPETFPSSEGEAESEPEPEMNTSNFSLTSETEPENWPEPGPKWQQAFQIWKWGWEIHIYFFAAIYLIMGLYAGYYVFYNIYDGLNKKYLSISLNIMVLVFGLSRAFILFLDPYHQGKLINSKATMRILWSIGGPCLTAADSLVILALVETAQVSLAPNRFQKPTNISAVIISHFLFVLLSDTIVSLYVDAKIMLLFCQIFFVLWGGVLGLGYFLLGYKLDKKLFGHKQFKEKEDYVYIYLIYASGVANIFIVLIMLYSAVSVFGVYSGVTFVDAWHWYGFQTISRLSETISCILVFTVSAKRTRVKKAMEEYHICNSGQQKTLSEDSKEKFKKAFQSPIKPKRITVSPLLKNSNESTSSSTLKTKILKNKVSCTSIRGRQSRTGKMIHNSLEQSFMFINTLSFPNLERSGLLTSLHSESSREQINQEFEINPLHHGLEASLIEMEKVTDTDRICSYTRCKSQTETNRFTFKKSFASPLRLLSARWRKDNETNTTKNVFNGSDDKIDLTLSEKMKKILGSGSKRQLNAVSALEQHKIQVMNTETKPNEESVSYNACSAELPRKPSAERSRARRMSMFSTLHEQKLDLSFRGSHLQIMEITEQEKNQRKIE